VSRIEGNEKRSLRRPKPSAIKGSSAPGRRRRLLALLCLSIHLSVQMEQFGSHQMDLNGILYLRIFQKSVNKIQVSLKSDNNNGYFT
jgi:hypothetical protein